MSDYSMESIAKLAGLKASGMSETKRTPEPRPMEPYSIDRYPEAWCAIALWEEHRADALEARVKELEAELAHTIMDPLAALINGKAKAEAQRDALLAAFKTREVRYAIGRFRGVAQFFDIGDCSAECDGNTLADAIEDAIAKVEGG